jgi:hypothetical protein
MTFEVHSFTNQKFSLERLYLAMSRCLKNPLVWLKRVGPAGTCWSSGNSLARLELVGPAGTCWSSELVGSAVNLTSGGNSTSGGNPLVK